MGSYCHNIKHRAPPVTEQHEEPAAKRRKLALFERVPARETKAWDDCCLRTRQRRFALVDEFCSHLHVPRNALSPSPRLGHCSLLHTTQAQRQVIRSVARIPGERQLRLTFQQLAESHGTATATFAFGSYITDPLKLLRIVTAASDFIAVGGDCGGGSTKLGVTYTDANAQLRFLPLVYYSGKDSNGDLRVLARPRLLRFSGQSEQFDHIFAVLQHLINRDPEHTYVNGDWMFLSAVTGHSGPSSLYPCPVCTAWHRALLEPAQHRNAFTDDMQLMYSLTTNTRLLRVRAENIVPLPLHVLLGLCSRIIEQTLPQLFSAAPLQQAVDSVKRTPASPATEGLERQHHLTGPEICKWIDTRRMQWLIDQHPHAKLAIPSGSNITFSRSKFIQRCLQLDDWMSQLRGSLLCKGQLSRASIDALRTLVSDIQSRWTAVTGTTVTPKVHMLRHCVDFASDHRVLGSVAESAIESCHATSNKLIRNNFFNLGSDVHAKMRGAQAQQIVAALSIQLTQ
jgi:hypothetical protein